MHPEADHATQRQQVIYALVAALIVVAVVLRFWRLGAWNLEATEIFTLRDSLRPRLTNPRPLGYLLNYYLVLPFMPLDEFGLRVLPALCGVLAVVAIYLVSRRLIGTRGALLCSLALTVSELHIYYSQFARYWSLVFLLCTIYPFALFLGIREHNRAALALGVIAGILAALAHPVAVLLLGGPAIWLTARFVRPDTVRRLWSRPGVRWATGAVVLLLVLIAVRFVPLLHHWITMHDRNPGSGQFLYQPTRNGPRQLVYLIAFVESLTVPVVLGAVAGLYVLWRNGDRTLAAYLTSLALFPLVFIVLLSMRTPVSQFYLVPTLPVYYIGVGVFLASLFDVAWPVRPRWLLPATLTLAILAAGAPSLVSQYRNGRRFDFRGVAQWLAQRLQPGDVVFSDQPMVLAHYLPDTPVQKLRTPAPLAAAAAELRQAGGNRALWVVAPQPAHAFRPSLKEGGLVGWLYGNCQLRNTVGVGRMDFRQQYLQVFRCPPVEGRPEG
jgi:hypothetical protein